MLDVCYDLVKFFLHIFLGEVLKTLAALLLLIWAVNSAMASIPDLRPLSPDRNLIQADLQRIIGASESKLPITFDVIEARKNQAHVTCSESGVKILVYGDHRWSQTFYMALQRLGYLFPHPRMQISPTAEAVRAHCGETYTWNPVNKYSGLHLHTLHPSEWVHGFLLGKEEIAFDTVRWLARNQQNIFDLSLLRQKKKTIYANLKRPFALAKRFGIHAGVTIGFGFHQQNSYKLISILGTFSNLISKRQLKRELKQLLDGVDVSFVNFELGTSEFTPVNYSRTLMWMNEAAKIMTERGLAMVVKVHVTTNQHHAKWGNFNFLPQYAVPEVGILPHTVYLYGLEDDSAPMYGNKDFKHIRDFMVQEKDKRRTWFYPETSYFIALDIDTGLLLTDYLITRAADTKVLDRHGIEGQLNFTTGHEMGYWLFDWSFTLFNNKDYNFDPLIGLKLMGEDVDSWKRILDFQNEYFKKKGLLSIVTFQNFGDEIAGSTHQTLKRNPLKTLNKRPDLIQEEIDLLEEAIEAMPRHLTIKNQELRLMIEITHLRMHHALKNRMAFLYPEKKLEYLDEAIQIRFEAQKKMNTIRTRLSRYPEAKTFERHKNPTAYPFGYAYGVKNLHYWHREEEVIRKKNFSPFFMNITDWLDIILKVTPGREKQNLVLRE